LGADEQFSRRCVPAGEKGGITSEGGSRRIHPPGLGPSLTRLFRSRNLGPSAQFRGLVGRQVEGVVEKAPSKEQLEPPVAVSTSVVGNEPRCDSVAAPPNS